MPRTLGDWERHRATDDELRRLAELPEAREPRYFAHDEDGTREVVTILMERDVGGWRTELRLTTKGEPAILVRQGDGRTFGCIVPPDKALDAFHHPYAYLPR